LVLEGLRSISSVLKLTVIAGDARHDDIVVGLADHAVDPRPESNFAGS
jgi:hypothetical protein